MHSTQHHCLLGKAVRKVENQLKIQFGHNIQVTYKCHYATISTYKHISEIYLKDTWEMVYCNCVCKVFVPVHFFKYLHAHAAFVTYTKFVT